MGGEQVFRGHKHQARPVGRHLAALLLQDPEKRVRIAERVLSESGRCADQRRMDTGSCDAAGLRSGGLAHKRVEQVRKPSRLSPVSVVESGGRYLRSQFRRLIVASGFPERVELPVAHDDRVPAESVFVQARRELPVQRGGFSGIPGPSGVCLSQHCRHVRGPERPHQDSLRLFLPVGRWYRDPGSGAPVQNMTAVSRVQNRATMSAW